MLIEQPGLAHRVRADEFDLSPPAGVFDEVELRARLEAAAATHAFTEFVPDLLVFGGILRSLAQVVCAVDGHPRLGADAGFRTAAVGRP